MSTMTDTIMQQRPRVLRDPFPVSSTCPLQAANPLIGTHPWHPITIAGEEERPPVLIETTDHGSRTVTDQSGLRPCIAAARAMDGQQGQPRPQRRKQRTLEGPLGSKSKSRPLGLKGRPQGDGNPRTLLRPPAYVRSPSRQARLAKASLSLPRRPSFEVSIGSHAEQSNRITVPIMVLGRGERPLFTSPYNDLLVVEIKVASTIVRRILIDIGSFMDITTCDCLKKLKYPGREIIPLVHPIFGFGDKR
ncbi:hypothetical protein Cgig2_003899 [Carnegiea gigantea]|uniref:Uncharacterized protein n=1 Tax=Carnegiea gigantea TaxID=171969 RepID=A0A9Q1GSA3_9CARY|nr:hypothetical protein Cgig2_003899 [Carnegiea gigantea]